MARQRYTCFKNIYCVGNTFVTSVAVGGLGNGENMFVGVCLVLLFLTPTPTASIMYDSPTRRHVQKTGNINFAVRRPDVTRPHQNIYAKFIYLLLWRSVSDYTILGFLLNPVVFT
jgi:hypothetical protein